MKHIVFDGRQLYTSSGRYAERLLHYLQQVDHEHRYTVLVNPKDFDGWEATNPNFTKVLSPYKEFTFGEQIGLRKQIKNMNPDLVFFPFAQQPAFYHGNVITTIQDLTTLRFRNPAKNLVVFTVKQLIYKWLNKRVIRKSKLLITISKFVRDDAAAFAGVPASKFTVTYEATGQLPRPAEPLPYLQKKKFILYVGRPQPHKNLWRVIEAFRLLQTDFPDHTLALIGKKDDAYDLIEARVQKEGIKNVYFGGFASDASLRWLYSHCDAYVFASLSEGFGIPALEAMEHGAPVASSNASCSPEVYGKGAEYFDPYDVNDMARVIKKILTDPKLRKDLAERGKKQAAKYSWKRMAEQTLDVFKKALDEK